MNDVMAIESIAEEYAKFHGYMTEVRVPFKLKKGISDLDVLGFNPRTRRTLVIECKAWGSPDQYYSFGWDWRFALRKDYFGDILKKWKKHFVKSGTNKWKLKRLDEIWLVLPGSCPEKNRLEKWLKKELGVTARIIPIHEMLLGLFEEVRKDKDVRRK